MVPLEKRNIFSTHQMPTKIMLSEYLTIKIDGLIKNFLYETGLNKSVYFDTSVRTLYEAPTKVYINGKIENQIKGIELMYNTIKTRLEEEAVSRYSRSYRTAEREPPHEYI